MPALNCSRSSSIHARQAERSGKQTRRLRREVEPRGVGRANHGGEPLQRRRRQTELLHHDVEGAELAAMAPEHVLDVERRGVETLGDGSDFGGRHEQKDRGRIDEAADQPGAGDAVDLRPRRA